MRLILAADIDIINAALSKLGEQALLSVADQSVPGRLANRTYKDIKEALLREYPWNFTPKRISLTAAAAAPVGGFPRVAGGACMAVASVTVGDLFPPAE